MQPIPEPKNSKWLAPIYVLLSLAIAIHAIVRPDHNWDMIAYVASAHSYQGLSKEQLHKDTFDALAAAVDEQTYATLTDPTHDYRSAMANNPALFAQQLPFYEIRVAYITAIVALQKLGMSPFFASHFLNAICIFFALIVLGLILVRLRIRTPVVALVPLLLIPFGAERTASLSTPDGIAVLATVVCAYLFAKRKLNALLAFLPFTILVRTDLIVLVGCFALYFVACDRTYLKQYCASALASLVVLFAINHHFDNYGWQTIFYFTLVERMTNPADVTFVVTPALYWQEFIQCLESAIHSVPFMIYLTLAIGVAGFQLKTRKRSTTSKEQMSLLALHYIGLGYVVAHVLIFPFIVERFFLAQFMLTVTLAISLLPPIRRQNPTND